MGLKSKMRITSSKSGVTKTLVIVLVIIVAVGGTISAYALLRMPSSTPSSTPTPTPTTMSPSPSPSSTPPETSPKPTVSPTSNPSATPTPAPPTPTPTPSATPTPSSVNYTHVVTYATLMQPRNENDYWNINATNPYTITLNDSMTASGDQYLQVVGLSNNTINTWEVLYQNSTYFQYTTWDAQGNQLDSAWLNCNNGIVQVTVTGTTITFEGTASFTSNVPFAALGEVWTANADGTFTSGELDLILTTT